MNLITSSICPKFIPVVLHFSHISFSYSNVPVAKNWNLKVVLIRCQTCLTFDLISNFEISVDYNAKILHRIGLQETKSV